VSKAQRWSGNAPEKKECMVGTRSLQAITTNHLRPDTQISIFDGIAELHCTRDSLSLCL